MANRKTYGKTASGGPITDELVAELAEKAKAGYDVAETLTAESGPIRVRRPAGPPAEAANDR